MRLARLTVARKFRNSSMRNDSDRTRGPGAGSYIHNNFFTAGLRTEDAMWPSISVSSIRTALACAAWTICLIPGSIAAAQRPIVRPLQIFTAKELAAKSDNELRDVVVSVSEHERAYHTADDALKKLESHTAWQDGAKWANVFLTLATTVVGSYGSSLDQKSTRYTVGTATLGAVSTGFTGLRDDKDLAQRIATCKLVAKAARKAIDTYYNTWIALVASAPPMGDPKRETFTKALADAGSQLAGDVADLSGDCQ